MWSWNQQKHLLAYWHSGQWWLILKRSFGSWNIHLSFSCLFFVVNNGRSIKNKITLRLVVLQGC